jgi:hypothetical protein
MKIAFPTFVFVIMAMVSITSCQQNSQTKQPKDKVVIYTTLGNLPKFIDLPTTPTVVKWQTETLQGDNWSLTVMALS